MKDSDDLDLTILSYFLYVLYILLLVFAIAIPIGLIGCYREFKFEDKYRNGQISIDGYCEHYATRTISRIPVVCYDYFKIGQSFLQKNQ